MRALVGRSLLLLAGIALAVGVAALWLRPSGEAPPVVAVDATPTPAAPEAPVGVSEEENAVRGGTYAGRVEDEQGRPVPGADVLLVARDRDARVLLESFEAEGMSTLLDVPVIGEFKTAARGRTDQDGRFSLPAGDALVLGLFAWAKGFSPALKAHLPSAPLRPGSEHVLRLARAGWLLGTVVDGATKDPVRGAEVTIYLQTRANQERSGPDPLSPSNAFARFHLFVARELGPLVWDSTPRAGDTGFRVVTKGDGTFLFGPVMKEVQVWAVITHPEYAWTEHDPEVVFESDNVGRDPSKPPLGRRRRIVVQPGETVERTFALAKGEEVRGTVEDGEGNPIEGVEVHVNHVAQYYQHPWYRTHPRTARTDAQGRFRVAGLSFEPYELRMTHPSFESKYFAGVKAGSDGKYQIGTSGGWIEVEVDGAPAADPVVGQGPSWTGRALLAARDRGGDRMDERVVVREGRFLLEKVKPGRYFLTLVSASQVSDPVPVEVSAGEGAQAGVRLRDGGSVRVSVSDAAGRPLDPVTVELDALVDGKVLRRAATLVGRQGLASADAVLPGVYQARARAPGYVAAQSESFEVRSGELTPVPALTLRRQAFLRVASVVDASGRAVAVDVHLQVSENGREGRPARTQGPGLLPVEPGTVILKAEAADGRRFEATFEVGDGATVPVEVRLDR